MRAQDGAWKTNPAQAGALKRLKDDRGLAAVVVQGQRTRALHDCGHGGGTDRSIDTLTGHVMHVAEAAAQALKPRR